MTSQSPIDIDSAKILIAAHIANSDQFRPAFNIALKEKNYTRAESLLRGMRDELNNAISILNQANNQ